jgi:hypothetical protein
MLKFLRSPIGWMLGATVVMLTLSPDARKTVRRMAVKGTATVLDIVEQVRNVTSNLREPQPRPVSTVYDANVVTHEMSEESVVQE